MIEIIRVLSRRHTDTLAGFRVPLSGSIEGLCPQPSALHSSQHPEQSSPLGLGEARECLQRPHWQLDALCDPVLPIPLDYTPVYFKFPRNEWETLH